MTEEEKRIWELAVFANAMVNWYKRDGFFEWGTQRIKYEDLKEAITRHIVNEAMAFEETGLIKVPEEQDPVLKIIRDMEKRRDNQ